MKRLFDVLVEKLKEVEATQVSLGLGVFGVITLIAVTSVINNLFKMIVTIAQVLSGTPVG